MNTSPASGLSSPMRCLSKTLLPPPLRPMMTTDSPVLNAKVHAIEDDLSAEAFLQVANFDHSRPKSALKSSVRKKFDIRMVMDE